MSNVAKETCLEPSNKHHRDRTRDHTEPRRIMWGYLVLQNNWKYSIVFCSLFYWTSYFFCYALVQNIEVLRLKAHKTKAT